MKCAGKVATCAAQCSKSIGSPPCIRCLGGSYQQCKDCVGLQAAVGQSNYNIQGTR